MYLVRWVRCLIVCLLAAALLPACSLDRNGLTSVTVVRPSAPPASAEATATPSAHPSSQHLGDIVDQYIRWIWTPATRDYAAYDDLLPRAMRVPSDVRTPSDWLDIMVVLHLRDAEKAEPMFARMRLSQHEAYQACLAEAGYPPSSELAGLSEGDRKSRLEALGPTDAKREELVARCWEVQLLYAGKDDGADRQIGLIRQYFLKAAEEWVEANPVLIAEILARESDPSGGGLR